MSVKAGSYRTGFSTVDKALKRGQVKEFMFMKNIRPESIKDAFKKILACNTKVFYKDFSGKEKKVLDYKNIDCLNLNMKYFYFGDIELLVYSKVNSLKFLFQNSKDDLLSYFMDFIKIQKKGIFIDSSEKNILEALRRFCQLGAVFKNSNKSLQKTLIQENWKVLQKEEIFF